MQENNVWSQTASVCENLGVDVDGFCKAKISSSVAWTCVLILTAVITTLINQWV